MKDNSKIIKNPILDMDYPDPDVIRVDDTYYMVTTTMHFMPGCDILRSYDLINWEHAAYIFDLYRNKIEPDRNIAKFALFTSFFPQVMSGPISKADELLPQIKSPHKFDYEQGKQGLKL